MNILTLIFGVEVRQEVSTFRRKYDMRSAPSNTRNKAEAAVTSIPPAQPRSEASAYTRWLRTEMSFQSYDDAVTAGVKAFSLAGKRVSEAQVREIFPQDDLAIAGLIFFVWDVNENSMTATRRLHANELHSRNEVENHG
jgi:hypothetical protein